MEDRLITPHGGELVIFSRPKVAEVLIEAMRRPVALLIVVIPSIANRQDGNYLLPRQGQPRSQKQALIPEGTSEKPPADLF